MPLWNEYHLPTSVDEAVAVLARYDGQARAVAGGTDLILDLQQGNEHPVEALVDVTRIAGLNEIRQVNGTITIGCGVTHNQIVSNELLHQKATCLVEASYVVGGPQVRNVATLGGNVAHALPAADGSISLLALDAQAEVACMDGRRRVPLSALFKGPGESTLDPHCDLLVGFYLPLYKKGQASAFSRRVSPQGIPLAILNLSVWLERKEDRIVNIRIAVGPSGPVPLRMIAAEKVLIDQTPSQEVLAHALDQLLNEAHFRTSLHRASAEYRRHLAGILLQEAFTNAWQRAE